MLGMLWHGTHVGISFGIVRDHAGIGKNTEDFIAVANSKNCMWMIQLNRPSELTILR